MYIYICFKDICVYQLKWVSEGGKEMKLVTDVRQRPTSVGTSHCVE